jgi:hypothetical protein
VEALLDAGLPVQIEPKFAPGVRGHLHVVAGVDPFQNVLFKLVFGAALLVLTDESCDLVGCIGKAVFTHFGVDHSLILVWKNDVAMTFSLEENYLNMTEMQEG